MNTRRQSNDIAEHYFLSNAFTKGTESKPMIGPLVEVAIFTILTRINNALTLVGLSKELLFT